MMTSHSIHRAPLFSCAAAPHPGGGSGRHADAPITDALREPGRVGALAAVTICFFLAACGGGGGGGGSDDGTAGGSTAAPAPAPASATVVTAALSSGTYWEYLADYRQQTSSSAGYSSQTDWGIFRMTLGAPATVAGVSGFAVTVAGKTTVGGHDFTPKVNFLGLSGQRWVGSSDGSTLVTLYDPSLASGSNGFFLNLGANRPVKMQLATLAGQYNSFAGVSLSDSTASGGCEYVLSVTICSQDSTSFSQLDYLKDGIGPVGFKLHSAYSFGGTAPEVIDSSLSLELIGTSLKPQDGSTVKPAPWSMATDLPTASVGGVGVGWSGKVYLYSGTSVQSYDPTAQVWSSSGVAPAAVAAAINVGAKIAAFTGSLRGYLHDPNAGTWTTLPTLPDATGANTLEGAVPWTHADGSTDVVLLISRGVIYTTLNVWKYQTATNSWVSLGSVDRGGLRGFHAASAGDKVYLVGGYLAPNYLSTVEVLDLNAVTLTAAGHPLTTAGSGQTTQTLGGKVYVAGGSNATGAYRGVDVIDPATGAVAAGPAMYEPRFQAASAVLDGRLYVIGGQANGTALKTVEVLTP